MVDIITYERSTLVNRARITSDLPTTRPESCVRCALVKGGNFYLLGVRSWTTSTLGFRPAH